MKLKVFTVRIPPKDMRELRKQYLPPNSMFDRNAVSDNFLVNCAVKAATYYWKVANMANKR